MKKISKYILILAALFAVGCDNYDDRYVEEYASVLRLSAFGENIISVPASTSETVYDLNVLRSGHNINCNAEASFRTMTDAEWTKYANTYGVQRYYKLPADCYKLGDSSDENGYVVKFAPNETVMPVSVTIYSEKLHEYSETLPPPAFAGEEWANVICIPFLLDVSKGSVFSERENLILRLVYKENE